MRKKLPAGLAIVVAGAMVASAAASAASAAAPSAEAINLIGGFGSVINAEGQMGVIGESWVPYTVLAPGAVMSAADVDCNNTWDAMQILCDPEPTTDVSGELTQSSVNTGYTSQYTNGDSVAFIVIDLAAAREFWSLEVFQMKQSDGAVTHADLFVSESTDAAWPAEGDGSWTAVAGGDVASGPNQTGTGPYLNTAVTAFSFDAVTGRYVMLQFRNNGIPNGFIEVAGVKLFGQDAPTPPPTPDPGPVPDPTLAQTGARVADYGVALGLGLALALGGGALAAASRRTVSRRR